MQKLLLLILLSLLLLPVAAQENWSARFDGNVRFYQTTDFGLLVVGTERTLYAVDGQTGEIVWRRSNGKLNETSITPIPGTDLILLSLDEGKKSRIVAVDLMTGDAIWTSEKVKGDVMQLAVEPEKSLLCVVLVKNPRGPAGEELKREPTVAVFELSSGELVWKRDLGGEVKMMPARFIEDGEVDFTLDNYRAPLILDERVFLFYEGATSFEARTGKEREREKFKVNEDGLALTEADPVFDDEFIYTSGRGKIRAVRRSDGEVEWEANDLGVTPEMVLVGDILYVRTGGQFTHLKDGETENKGSFGVSALDRRKGKTVWRYKGADKGLTNFVFSDQNTILIADRDDLIAVEARNGKPKIKFEHKVEKAQFVLLNERGEAVIGGRDEIAAFDITNLNSATRNPQSVWRAKYKAPGRGLLKVIASMTLRATALYFRYGGLINTGFNIFRGAQILRSVSGLRWSGLKTRFGSIDLTSLATNATRNYVRSQIRVFGITARAQSNGWLNPNFPTRPNLPNLPNGKDLLRKVTPSKSEVQERLLDRIDPVRQIERLADWLMRRKRLAELRGNYMYFYTDLGKEKGLAGVNIHNGYTDRRIPLEELDPRFVTDEVAGFLYSADGNRLTAYSLTDR
jgi:outer membrane protein assembly factor BamB